MGISIEGSDQDVVSSTGEIMMLSPNPYTQSKPTITIFNKGKTAFTFTLSASSKWIKFSKTSGKILTEELITLSIDWNKVPLAGRLDTISIGSTTGQVCRLAILLPKRTATRAELKNIFLEDRPAGAIGIEAAHFSRAINTNGIIWTILPDLGRTGSSVTAFPVTAKEQIPGANAPHLEYDFYIENAQTIKVNGYFSPTLNFHNTLTGLRYAVSIDNEEPKIITINKEDNNVRKWEQWVASNIIITSSMHSLLKPGKHILKIWMVDPGVVLQKLVIDTGAVGQSYLGTPETLVK
jgi:phage-related protein